VSKAVNFDMSPDGQLDTRGGGIKLTDTAVASTGESPELHQFIKRETDGTLTLKTMLKSGTVLYGYNTSTGVFDSVQTGLSTDRASMINFVNAAGAEVMLYADGSNFIMYDGSTVTNIASNYTAGNAASAPRYIFAKHNVCFAVEDDNPDVLFFCDLLAPNSNWPSQGFLILEGGIDRITGIGEIYDYVLVTTLNSVYIITGRTRSQFALIKVNSTNGCTSHHSIVSHEGFVYWANQSGFKIGKLRRADSDGMEVEHISNNIQNTFEEGKDGFWNNIVGTYHSEKKSIYWTMKAAASDQPDRLFAYSVIRSRPELPPPDHPGPDLRFVWSGYYEGYNFNAVKVIEDSTGKDELYVADEAGLVYLMHSGYKDKRAVGASTGTDVSYEIRGREETRGGAGREFRIMTFLPLFYQQHNGGFNVQFLVNRSQLVPSSAVTVSFRGNIPYYNDGTVASVTTLWGSSVWSLRPVLNAKISLKTKVFSVIPLIKSSGSNPKEEGTWVGCSWIIQDFPVVQGKAA